VTHRFAPGTWFPGSNSGLSGRTELGGDVHCHPRPGDNLADVQGAEPYSDQTVTF